MALAIRAIARALMGGAVRRGLSARSFRREIVSQFGSSYRWTTLLSDYREFTGMIRFEKAVRSLKPTTKPPANVMTEVDMRRERRYKGVGVAKYRNLETGETYDQHISMYSNTFESKESFTKTFIQDKKVSEYLPEFEIVTIDWYAIQHKEGWSW